MSIRSLVLIGLTIINNPFFEKVRTMTDLKCSFDIVNDKPTVIIPPGFKLTEKFATNREHVITVNKLTTDGDGNTKLRKNRKRTMVDQQGHVLQWVTVGLSLAPHSLSGFNTCGSSTVACRKGCLDGCGMRAVWENMHLYKIAKTVFCFSAREMFLQQFHNELQAKQRAVAKLGKGYRVACRPNVFSDLRWEDMLFSLTDHSGYGMRNSSIIDANPAVWWYDYTKHNHRSGWIRDNYHVTFSRSDKNHKVALRHLRDGFNVAVVFASRRGKQFTRLPKTFHGFDVVDGNDSDLRFLDPEGLKRGKVVGLTLKAPTTKAYQEALATGFPVLQP